FRLLHVHEAARERLQLAGGVAQVLGHLVRHRQRAAARGGHGIECPGKQQTYHNAACSDKERQRGIQTTDDASLVAAELDGPETSTHFYGEHVLEPVPVLVAASLGPAAVVKQST